jgi:hypothetical protein
MIISAPVCQIIAKIMECTALPDPNVTITYTGASALLETANPVTDRNSAEGCSMSPEIRSPAGPEVIAFPMS